MVAYQCKQCPMNCQVSFSGSNYRTGENYFPSETEPQTMEFNCFKKGNHGKAIYIKL
jgi:hypothetical protein